MRHVPAALALIAVLWPAAAIAADGEMRPLVVVSFSGLQRFADDVRYLGEQADNPHLLTAVSKYLSDQSNITKLQGVATDRPLGAMIATDGLAISPVAFVPVTDVQAMFDSLRTAIGPPQPIRAGLWKVGRREWTGFVRTRDGWAFLAQSEEALEHLPDPERVLGDLPKRYDGALQINAAEIPEVFRTMAIDLVRISLRKQLERREGESEAAHDLRCRALHWRFGCIEQLLTQSRQITAGWNLDEQAGQMVLDLEWVPQPGGSLARQFASLGLSKTRFAGLGGEERPLGLHVTWSLTKDQVAAARGELQAGRGPALQLIEQSPWVRSEQDREAFAGLSTALADIVEATVGSGQIDLAVAAEGRQAPVTLVAAAHVGRGAALRAAFSRLSELAQNDPRFSGFRTDVAKIGEHSVHAFEFTNGARMAALEQLVGEENRLLAVFDDENVYLAVGPVALEALERAMQPNEAEVAPVQLDARLGTLVELTAGTIDEQGWRSILALAGFALRGGDNRVQISLQAIDDGLRLRLRAENGILRAGALALGLKLLGG